MAGTRDTRPAVWGSKVKKWRRWIAELRTEAGVNVIIPGDFDTPPHLRTCPAIFTADRSNTRCRMLVVEHDNWPHEALNAEGDIFWW